jgi:hypothetical protein
MKDKYYQQVMCSDASPREQGKYITNLGEMTYSGTVMIPNNAIKVTAYIEQNGYWGHETSPKIMAMVFPIWWLKLIDPMYVKELAWQEGFKAGVAFMYNESQDTPNDIKNPYKR